MSGKNENIYKRKDSRWEGRYKKGRDINGKLIYGSVYGKTYEEVKEKLDWITSNSKYTTFYNKDNFFQDILFLWLENNKIKYKGATENRYEYLINTHIIPELGKFKVTELSAPQINTFLFEKLQNGRLDHSGGLSPAYVRSIMLIIHSALNFAVNEELCLPLKTPIYKPNVKKKELTIFNLSQQKQLEQYLLLEPNQTKIGILISLYSGLRIGEICALTWDDIDFKNNIIHVRHTIARVKNTEDTKSFSRLIMDSPKTPASVRDIPISSHILPILSEARSLANSKYVISNNISFVNPRTYEYRYHKLLDECGLPHINYHALRHTFATRCIEAGVDVKSLSEILGHSNVSITLNTYVHSSIELKRFQLEKLTTLPQ